MNVKLFRKKPVVIEAVQLTPHNIEEVTQWCGGVCGLVSVAIPTLEGNMIAWGDKGDWIIKGVAGEFYPCRDEIFTATYEEA